MGYRYIISSTTYFCSASEMSWSTTVKSPNYPNQYSNSGSKTWLISAPIPGSTIDLEFDEFIVRQLKNIKIVIPTSLLCIL